MFATRIQVQEPLPIGHTLDMSLVNQRDGQPFTVTDSLVTSHLTACLWIVGRNHRTLGGKNVHRHREMTKTNGKGVQRLKITPSAT